MTDFIDDDEGYFSWLEQNTEGFVVNCYRKPKATYLMLHRAPCPHIQRWEGRTLTSGDYRKVCSTAVGELHNWASTLEGALTACRTCQPLPIDGASKIGNDA